MSTYYNDNEPYVCEWLRNLQLIGFVSQGDVVCAPIQTIEAWELQKYNRCHFFAGIGGWDYALQLAGWPEGREVWTGSCPCQPFSVAGKRKGVNDERHLWPYFFELIKQCRPATVFGEQVASADGRKWLAGVFADLESLGYAVAGADLCAAGVGAPHIRQRLYWLAYTGSQREVDERTSDQLGGSSGVGWLGISDRNGWLKRQSSGTTLGQGYTPDSTSGAGGLADIIIIIPRLEGRPEQSARHECQTAERNSSAFWNDYELIPCADGKARRIEPGTFPLAHGIPARVGKLRAYGNAIVPQVAATFIRAFLEL